MLVLRYATVIVTTLGILSVTCHGEDYNPSAARGGGGGGGGSRSGSGSSGSLNSRATGPTRGGKQRESSSFQGDRDDKNNNNDFDEPVVKKTRANKQKKKGRGGRDGDGDNNSNNSEEDNSVRGSNFDKGGGSTRGKAQQGRANNNKAGESLFQEGESLGRGGGTTAGGGGGRGSRGKPEPSDNNNNNESDESGVRPKKNNGKTKGQGRGKAQQSRLDQGESNSLGRGKVDINNSGADADDQPKQPAGLKTNSKSSKASGVGEQVVSVDGGNTFTAKGVGEQVVAVVEGGNTFTPKGLRGKLGAKGEGAATPKGGAAVVVAVGTASKVDTLFQTAGDEKTCGVKPIVPKAVPATWVGSFPGSGAEVTWQLIQAITGLATDEDTSNIGHAAKGFAVAIKTHFPSLAPANAFINLQKKLNVKQAILLIRNPMSAIPSYFNFQWEQEHGLKPHSRRAPPNRWVQWRNGNFENELVRWVDHVRWWVDSFHINQPPGQLHLMVFEHLVNPDTGVNELMKVGRFLKNVSPDIAESMIPFKEFTCVWQMLVVPSAGAKHNSKRNAAAAAAAAAAGGGGDATTKTLRGPRSFPYTSINIQLMNQHLNDLKNEYSQSFPEFSDLMQEYLNELETQFLFMKTE